MLQSLFVLPIAALIEAGLFLLLYFLTPLNSRMAAVSVALLTLFVLYGYSIVQWPGVDVLAMYTAVLMVTPYLLAIIGGVWEKRRLQGDISGRWFHWAPFALVSFFLVLFAADSVFVFVSKDGLPPSVAGWLLPETDNNVTVQSAFPGVIQRNFQKKETLYNDYLQQVQQQQQRGWQIQKGWLGRPVAGQEAVFQIKVLDKAGEPVSGAVVSGMYQRPANSRLDQGFEMDEVDIGLYQVKLVLPNPGAWDLALYIQRGDQRHQLHAKTSVDAIRQ